MPALIVIKKYPNRRLYDTSQSQYVNLDYIRELVIGHTDFEVLDSKTGEDITQTVLLQIITEMESSDQQSILTNTLLKQLIRFYGNDMQVFLRQYLEQSLVVFLERQDALQGVVKDMVKNSPIGLLGQMVEKNIDFWRQFGASGKNKHDKTGKDAPDKDSADQDKSVKE
jgi:polyhydroxyalkanoate synthesis repressor PhaR